MLIKNITDVGNNAEYLRSKKPQWKTKLRKNRDKRSTYQLRTNFTKALKQKNKLSILKRHFQNVQ